MQHNIRNQARWLPHDRRAQLKSSNTRKLPEIVTALTSLPLGTLIDGELIAIDNDTRPDFILRKNYRSSEAHLVYFAFDILAHIGLEPNPSGSRTANPFPLLIHCPMSAGVSLVRRAGFQTKGVA